MNKKILIFPADSNVGLEILRSLMFSRDIQIYGGSSSCSGQGKFFFKNYITNLPFINDENFIDRINQIVDEYSIDFIFPAHDEVVLRLKENINRLKCEIIGPPLQTCKICRSKLETYKHLQGIIDTPKIYNINERSLDFPVFLKPVIGQGSINTFIAKSPSELEFYLEKYPGLFISEYLPGREYTVDCFTDRHGKLLFSGARERVKIKNGISINTTPVTDLELEEMAKKINNSLEFRGVWFFQVKEDINNQKKIMEIAARTAGAMGLYRNLGINLPLLTVYDYLGYDVCIQKNSFNLEMEKSYTNNFKTDIVYKNVYVDLDDTLILNGEINHILIGFLYQCLNKGIQIHLITKHAGVLNETLRKYRIENLFDNIIHLGPEMEKSDFINNNESIFIDDSYFEREKVKTNLNIPVFHTGSLECLLDSRF